jgi:hypothetical protein
MKVFFHPGFNVLSEYFQEEDYNIPFLGSTLIDFVSRAYVRFAEATNNSLEIFVPDIWDVDFPKYDYVSPFLNDEYEAVFITSLFSLPVLDFSVEDYQFLIQNPGKFFRKESEFQLGFLNKKSNLNELTSETLFGFNNVINLTQSNFLRVNQSLINNFNGKATIPGSYGLPVLIAPSENIINSKICAPCFVGEDIKIYNSVIYPGTVLTGNSIIENSEIFESFVCESSVKNSVIKNSLVALSSIDHVNLEDSVVPKGSVLVNGRKR